MNNIKHMIFFALGIFKPIYPSIYFLKFIIGHIQLYIVNEIALNHCMCIVTSQFVA